MPMRGLADERAVGVAIRLVVVAVIQRFGRGEGDFAGKHLVNQGLSGVNRDAHADALDGAAGVVRAGVLQRRDAHQFAIHIEHAAAGVAGVNRGIHLNHGVGDGGLAAILVVGFGLNRAVQGADDTDRRGLGEAQRVADVDGPVADLQGVAVAQRDRRQVKARRVHNGDIQRFVIRNKRRGVLVGVAAVIRHGHTQATRVLHNVVIRQHEALTDNHARAGSRQLLALLNLLIIVAAVAIAEAIAKIEVVAIAAIAHGLIVAHADHAVTHLLHRRGERLVTTVVVEFAAVTASAAADVFCAAIVAPAPIIAQVKPSAIQPIIFRNFITAVPPSGSKIEFHAAVRISGVQSVFPTGYAFIISAFFVFVMNDF